MKIAFLDRDGTLINEPQDDSQVDSLSKLRVLDGVIEGLGKLRDAGFGLVLVSNQNGIGSESFPKENFRIAHEEFLRILGVEGIRFVEQFICPHFPENNCDCRKPKTGLVDEFIKVVDLKNSFMCGDRDTDGEFAQNIGVKFYKMQSNGDFSNIINQLEL